MAKYQVGQKLWLDPIYDKRAIGREATVKAVGRKWITLDCNRKFDAKCDLPLRVHDGDRRVFESQEHATRYRRVSTNWSNLVMHLRNHPLPTDMTTEKIIAAAELLGIDYEIVKGKETKDD